MNPSMRALGLLGGFLLLASTGRTQAVVAPASNGPLVGIPTLFSATADTSGLTSPDRGAEGWFKKHGFEALPPVPLDAATSVVVPDFSAKALFRDPCGIPSATPLPEIDATTLGLDWITVGPGGIVAVPPGHWSGIVFSVTHGTVGKHGQLLGETTRGDGYAKSGADVFSYIFRGSALPPELVDVTQRANDASEIRLPADGEIDALDVYAPLYRLAIASRLRLPAMGPYLFFSVSAGTLGSVPETWWSGKPKSGATIFVSVWDQVTKKWSCPSGFFAPKDLGLDDTDDIDAFAYDPVQLKVLLSTRTPARNPILYVDLATDAAIAVPLVYADTKPVSEQVGLGGSLIDDVDAICALDPGAQIGVNLQAALGVMLNFPRPPSQLRVEVQGYRDVSPQSPSQQLLSLLVVGGRPGGFAIPFLSPPNQSVLIALAPQPIPATSPFHGSPVVLHLPIPAALPPTGLLFDWLTLPPSGPVPFGLGVPAFVEL